MPILSTAAQNASLNNDYGATKGPNSPAAHRMRLWIGDPDEDGIEVPDTTETEAGTVANGYGSVVITNNGTTWLAAVDGQKSMAAGAQFPDALEAYPGTVTHATLEDSTDAAIVWDAVELLAPLDVLEAGDGPAVSLTIFYATDPITEE